MVDATWGSHDAIDVLTEQIPRMFQSVSITCAEISILNIVNPKVNVCHWRMHPGYISTATAASSEIHHPENLRQKSNVTKKTILKNPPGMRTMRHRTLCSNEIPRPMHSQTAKIYESKLNSNRRTGMLP